MLNVARPHLVKLLEYGVLPSHRTGKRRRVRFADLMDRTIPDDLVDGYEEIIVGLTLSDPDDRHVLAAAIRCSASVIVIFNQRDFPANVLASYGVESQHPDEFVENFFDLDPAAVVAAAQRQRAQLKHPPLDVDRYLGILF